MKGHVHVHVLPWTWFQIVASWYHSGLHGNEASRILYQCIDTVHGSGVSYNLVFEVGGTTVFVHQAG